MALYVVFSPRQCGTEPDQWTTGITFTASSGTAQQLATTATGSTYHEVTIGSALPLE